MLGHLSHYRVIEFKNHFKEPSLYFMDFLYCFSVSNLLILTYLLASLLFSLLLLAFLFYCKVFVATDVKYCLKPLFVLGFHFHSVYVRAKSLRLCPTLCNPMDCSLPGSSVHEIIQAIILEWVAISFSKRSS